MSFKLFVGAICKFLLGVVLIGALLFLPAGTLIMVLFCNFKFGWSFDKFKEEANTGKGVKVANWMKYYFRYILPIIIGVILVCGVISPFVDFI